MTKGFAIYRLPGEQCCTFLCGATDRLSGVHRVFDREGFVIAPFDTVRYPIVNIRPDEVTVYASERDMAPLPSCHIADCPCTSDYSGDFSRSMSLLADGSLQKIVVARCSTEPRGRITPEEMFKRACRLYPDAYVALFYTEMTGMWLVATPELLLSHSGGRWHTMALAGTMTAPEGEWSDKNRHEQQVVDRYIADTLTRYTDDVRQTAPAPVRAGALMHLRTDFDFTLQADPGALLADLFPTPAVCGMPKDKAYSEIVHHHSLDRLYYSGFCGTVAASPETGGVTTLDGATRLYVSLRCMHIGDRSCTLFAGGGLMPQSSYDAEYAETDSKMETMRRLTSHQP